MRLIWFPVSDSHADVQQYPSPDKVDGSTADGQHQLPDEYQVDETDVLLMNAHIHDGLGEEGKNQLQQAPHQCPEDDLPEVSSVLLHVAEEETERTFLSSLLPLLFVELLSRLQKEGDSFFFPLRTGAHPMLCKLLPVVVHQPLSRVGYIELLSFLYSVEHHEVVLVSMEDAGQGSLLHLLHRNPTANATQAQLACCFADAV